MTIYLPSLPNAPLKNRRSNQHLAPVKLRYNEDLHFLENESFSSSLIDYSQDYENSQAHSAKFISHMKYVLEILKTESPKESLIVEVGCGKGNFVELIQNDGYFNVKGFDASYEGSNKSIEKRYLSTNDKITADIVVLRHVLEHVQQPHDFLTMLRSVFGAAKVYIEVPNYDWIIDNQTYFDITYEHVNYFSRTSLEYLFSEENTKYGLLFDNQYHYVISGLSSINQKFKTKYESSNWTDPTFDALFPNILKEIERIENVSESKQIFLWGAATKGCLFLAHCATKKRLIDRVSFAIDVNPKKIGKFLPGSLVEIKSKYDFFEAAKDGDVLLISNPAYKDEIKAEIDKANISNVIIETL
jgi:hypothetical protein